MKIGVTGAAGSVGREALRALDDHEVTAVAHSEHADLDSGVVEIGDRRAVRDVIRAPTRSSIWRRTVSGISRSSKPSVASRIDPD